MLESIHTPWNSAESRKNNPVTVSILISRSFTTSNPYPLRPVLFHAGFTRKMSTSMSLPAPALKDAIAHPRCQKKQKVCINPSHRSRLNSSSQQTAHLQQNCFPQSGPHKRLVQRDGKQQRQL